MYRIQTHLPGPVPRRRVRGIAVAGSAVVFAGAGLGLAPAAMADPPGNNGTVKVDGTDIESVPDNDPHVGCTFTIDWFNFDAAATSTVTFALQAPTTDGSLSVDGPGTVTLQDDPAGGAGGDPDGSQAYTLSFDGSPQPQQGYHVKLTVNTTGSQGSDVKSKVFWVQGCDAPTPEPTPTAEPSPTESPTVLPTEGTETPEPTEQPSESPSVLGTEDSEESPAPAATQPPSAAPEEAAAVPTEVAAGATAEPDNALALTALAGAAGLAALSGGAVLLRRRRG